MKNRFWARKVAMILVFVPLALTAFGLLVMFLWNATLPSLLNVSPITFWQALGILLLSKILFGGFHGRWGGRRNHWKNEMERKLANMTPEEKEKFKQDWKNRCASWGRRVPEKYNASKTSEPSKPSTD